VKIKHTTLGPQNERIEYPRHAPSVGKHGLAEYQASMNEIKGIGSQRTVLNDERRES